MVGAPAHQAPAALLAPLLPLAPPGADEWDSEEEEDFLPDVALDELELEALLEDEEMEGDAGAADAALEPGGPAAMQQQPAAAPGAPPAQPVAMQLGHVAAAQVLALLPQTQGQQPREQD